MYLSMIGRRSNPGEVEKRSFVCYEAHLGHGGRTSNSGGGRHDMTSNEAPQTLHFHLSESHEELSKERSDDNS